MKKIFFLIALTLLCFSKPRTQNGFWNTTDAYLGQKPPLDTPQAFGVNILTRGDTFAFDRVAFSDDGKEFYYPSNNTWFDSKNSKIRYFKFENGKWNGPHLAWVRFDHLLAKLRKENL